jgi:hypothetical protein|tara:strand:- start:678 stop:893 length:216 start_codon:yes stop_codon:yes gene_type:complete
MNEHDGILPENWTVEEAEDGILCLMDEDGFMVLTKPNHTEIFRRLSAAMHWHSGNSDSSEDQPKKVIAAEA